MFSIPHYGIADEPGILSGRFTAAGDRPKLFRNPREERYHSADPEITNTPLTGMPGSAENMDLSREFLGVI